MKVTLTPERPSIFLGQPFTLQFTVSDPTQTIQWVSAQIVGKTRTLKPATHPFLQSLVNEALGGVQNAPFFGHVMSGSRMIASNLSGHKSFSLTILADHIPPSYDGAGLLIAYELLIACNAAGVIDKSRSFPLHFIGPQGPASVRLAQRAGVFKIQSAEADLLPGRLSLPSPFRAAVPADQRDFVVQREGGVLAVIRMAAAAAVGNPIAGVISIEKADSGVGEVKASLVRRETFGDGRVVETSEICARKIELNGVLARRFSIPVPFGTVADFEVEFMKVSHHLEFVFFGKDGNWKWAAPIAVFPPEISPTKPRVLRE
jgi:hypothetical protein